MSGVVDCNAKQYDTWTQVIYVNKQTNKQKNKYKLNVLHSLMCSLTLGSSLSVQQSEFQNKSSDATRYIQMIKGTSNPLSVPPPLLIDGLTEISNHFSPAPPRHHHASPGKPVQSTVSFYCKQQWSVIFEKNRCATGELRATNHL